MSSAVVGAPAPESAPLSAVARIINTYIAPGKTFTDLRRNNSWWAPWLLISIVSLAFIFAMDKQVGFVQITKNEIAKSSRADQFERLPADQRARQLQTSATITRYITYSAPVINLIAFLVIAAVLMAVFRLGAGADVPFKTSLAIAAYGSLPGIIAGLLGIISLLAGVDPEGFNVRNAVASNPAYFMDPTGNKLLYGLATIPDIFSIWNLALMGVGFACNSKVKRGTAMAMVAGCYLVYKLLGIGLGALFS